MSNILWRIVVMAGVVVLGLQLHAEGRPHETLNLQSGYSGKVLVDGARQVILSVTLDEKGGGSGTLALDSNIRAGGTSTTAAREIPIRIRLIQDEEHAAKGR